VNARWFHRGGRKKIGLLLIVAFDRHAVIGSDDRFEQLGGLLGRAEFSAYAAERSGPRQPRGAIGLVPRWV
jgi:hypothetical protein